MGRIVYRLLLCSLVFFCVNGMAEESEAEPVAMLHATDLFRPHNDPDDHWDLACVYALANLGRFDLRGILIDYPPKRNPQFNPDINAVSQLNTITGLAVPIITGGNPQDRKQSERSVHAILSVLQASPDKVVINVVGSCRDIAKAGQAAPELFEKKCKAIYLNAGTGSPDKDLASHLEYNVSLDPASYSSIFTLPCPVYWMPCFEEIGDLNKLGVMEYGTFYKFKQDEILPYLSGNLQNYFVYMFGRFMDHNWLHYLSQDVDHSILDQAEKAVRNMWCTGGFFYAAGYTVEKNGKLIPLHEAGDQGVFSFDPIRITCGKDGVTQWQPEPGSTNRFIFHVQDRKNYAHAMTEAMKKLLCSLP